MTCIVTGFPSKIAALQFEWAWQNTHLTRHIPVDERLTQALIKTRISPRSGKERKKVVRPRLSLTDRISNLVVLLSVKSFERWPLSVTFFSEDVHRMWERWRKRLNRSIRKSISVTLEKGIIPTTISAAIDQHASGTLEIPVPKGIDAIDVTYESMKPQVVKSKAAINDDQLALCTCCRGKLRQEHSMILVCPAGSCNASFHIDCLSRDFLHQEKNSDAMIPTEGTCPGCRSTVQWADLVRNLSLRTRGQKEFEALFKTKRKKATKASTDPDSMNAAAQTVASHDHDAGNNADTSEEDDWTHIDDIPGEDGPMSEGISADVPIPWSAGKEMRAAPKLGDTVEDSDWDDAELVE